MPYDIWKYWKHWYHQFFVFVSPLFDSVLSCFCKIQTWFEIEYVLAALVFLSSNFYLSTSDNLVYNNVKLCNHLQLYGPDYISTCNELHKTCFLSHFSILTISKLKAINNNKSFYHLILILSDEINLNPAPVHHPPNLKEWDIFKISGFHLLHVNINSLLPKIDEVRYAAKLINAAVRGIIELKLDN